MGQSHLSSKWKSQNLNPVLSNLKGLCLVHGTTWLPISSRPCLLFILFGFFSIFRWFSFVTLLFQQRSILENIHTGWSVIILIFADSLPHVFGSLQMVKLDEILMKNYRVICLTLPLGTLGKWDNSSQCAASLVS